METNYVSRFKSELDGKEYFITTRNSFEHVIVKLDSEIEEDVQWENYSITVQDLSDNTVQSLQLSVSGECDFWIKKGDKYSINLPKVGTL
jgi:phenylpropionate dioxygenase-like ring-hydroxylating dioxygenase large terminal subunit